MDLFIQSPYDLSPEEELEDSSDDEDVFTAAKILNKIVVQYISSVSSQHGHVTDMLRDC